MKTKLILLSLFAVLSSSLSAWNVGDHILAQYTDFFWYPGTIKAINGDNYDITYDDGDKLTVKGIQIKKIDWTAGTTLLQVNKKGAGIYYTCTVISRNGNDMTVKYKDDGEVENTQVKYGRGLNPKVEEVYITLINNCEKTVKYKALEPSGREMFGDFDPSNNSSLSLPYPIGTKVYLIDSNSLAEKRLACIVKSNGQECALCQ